MILAIVFGVFGIFAFCASAVAVLAMNAPVADYDEVDELRRILAYSAHLRDQQDAAFREFLDLHGTKAGSDAADELMSVIYDGEDYATAMERVIEQ